MTNTTVGMIINTMFIETPFIGNKATVISTDR